MYKYKYYRKAIPAQYQEQLGLTEFKITLKDISKKHENLIKSKFEIEFENVFRNIEDFDKDKLKKFMKLVYHHTIYELYGKKHNYIDKFFSVESKKKLILKEELSNYLEFKKDKVGEKTFKNYGFYVNELYKYFGEDIYLNNITFDDVDKFCKNVTLSISTFKNYIAFYNAFFIHLIDRKKIEENPFKLVKLEDNIHEETREIDKAFEKEEIENLLSSKKGEIKLAMMIQAYTGMRIGEVALLKKKNLINFEVIKIDYMKDTRTKKHNRDIPIHPKLKAYLEDKLKYFNENDNLFKKPDSLGTKINYHINLQFKDKSSHSFRYSFRQHMQYNFPDREKYINVLTAHSNSKDIGFYRYGKNKTNWDILVDMINSIDWEF